MSRCEPHERFSFRVIYIAILLSTLSEIFFSDLRTRRTSFSHYLSRRGGGGGGGILRRRHPKSFLLKNASAAAAKFRRGSDGSLTPVVGITRPHPPRRPDFGRSPPTPRPNITPPLRNRPPPFRRRRHGNARPPLAANARHCARANFPAADPHRRRRCVARGPRVGGRRRPPPLARHLPL